MEQTLFILLGAFLATLGGFSNQLIQNFWKRKEEDRRLIHQAIFLLQKYANAENSEKILVGDELFKLGIKIRSKKFHDFAEKIIKVDEVETDKISNLMAKGGLLINKPLVKKVYLKNDE